MSFLTSEPSEGVLLPEEIEIIRAVVKQVSSERWFTDDQAEREKFAAYVMHMYLRGMTVPEKLQSISATAAKAKFAKRDVSMKPLRSE
jgi:hypothetical protein